MTLRSTGPFRAGDSVQLTDPKGRLHTVVLQPGKAFHTHRGAVAHDDLIGAPGGDRGEGPAVRHAVPGAAAAAVRLRAVDAARRRGGLPEGRGPDRGHGRRLPRRPGGRGRRRLGRADLLAAARGRRRRPGGHATSGGRTSPRSPGATWSGSSAARTRPGSCATATSAAHPADRAGRPGRARHAGAVGGAATRSPRRWCPAACWSRTWPRRRSCPGSSRRCGSTAGSPSRRPGRRWSGRWHVVGLAVRPEHRMVGHTAFLVSARRLAPGRHRAGPAAPAGQGGRRGGRRRGAVRFFTRPVPGAPGSTWMHVARALLGRVEHVQPQVLRHPDPAPGAVRSSPSASLT